MGREGCTLYEKPLSQLESSSCPHMKCLNDWLDECQMDISVFTSRRSFVIKNNKAYSFINT